MKSIRTTEIRTFIKASGEEGIVKVLEQLSERQSALEQQQQEVAIHLLNMTKVVDQVTSGAGAMREQIEKMQGGPDDDDLPFAQN